MNDFANTLLQLILYILRIITPFFALLIIYQCFSSLRNHRRQEQPLITLGNLATRDLIPVIYWENSIGRGKTCDIRLGAVPLAETVATAVLEELQLTDEPAGSVVAVSFFATAPLERSVV